MKKILVIQNKRIGDVLISSVIAENIKKVFPESEVTYFVYDYTAGVLENNPYIDRVIQVSEKKLKHFPKLMKTIHKIKAEKYDIIFDPYSKFQSRLTCLLSGAEYRIGFKRIKKNVQKKGAFHLIGLKADAGEGGSTERDVRQAGGLVLTEGVATGASVHQATGLPVAVAFDAYNLSAVALALRTRYPDIRLIIDCFVIDEIKRGGVR